MQDFVSHFELGSRIEWDYDIVPVSSIMHPLFVLQDYGNEDNKFFCVLPKRTWPDYFSNLINKINPISTDDRDADSNSRNSVLLEINNINNSASDSFDLEADVMEEAEDESDLDLAALPITDDDDSNCKQIGHRHIRSPVNSLVHAIFAHPYILLRSAVCTNAFFQ